MSLELLSTELSRRHLRITPPRKHVYSVLLQRGPLSVQEIITSTIEHIDRASVYRTIQLFESLGFVKRLNQGWKYNIELSEQFTYHHHHIICRQCNTSVEIGDDDKLETIITSMGTSKGYANLAHDLEISGICQNCRA